MADPITRPFKRDYAAILAKYPPKTSVRAIARAEGIHHNTLHYNIRRQGLRPVKRRTWKTLGRTRRVMLERLLDKVNDLRKQDMTGPEACGAITDIILDALDAQGG